MQRIVSDPSDIDLLRGKESTYANLHCAYDEKMLEQLKRNLRRPDSFYLLVQDRGQFVAFCATDSDWWEPQHFFLREIFVMPGFQGRRIGEGLMRESIGHARTHGARGIATETAPENLPMRKLCEKCGFVQWENPQWKEGITYKLMFAE